MLGDEFPAFERTMEEPHLKGIRINTLKFSLKDAARLGLPLRRCPFCDSGFYLETEGQGVGNSPWHHAGAFYSQEPSAMSAVTVLAPMPGDKVLDMCAAPGGKSTQIAAALGGEGLLWSNEYLRKRAQILLSNVERMGIRNCVVSSAHPDKLAEGLEGFFDKVLVDAPCSGEGMFRRDAQAAAEWSPEHSASCAVRQLAILESAAKCLRDGGILVYSTCTFSFRENENVVIAFLDRHPEFELVPSDVTFGRTGYSRSDRYDLTLTRRIFPMDGGEGHFAARLRKSGECSSYIKCLFTDGKDDGEKSARALFEECFRTEPYGRIIRFGDNCCLIPEMTPDAKGLGVIRGGVLLGEILKNRIEPSHALFMASHPEECRNVISLSPDSPELAAFLHGEEIGADSTLRGFTAVACGDVITGFGKCSGRRLKNRYPKGLRTL